MSISRPFHPTAGSTKNIAATAASANVNLIIGGAAPGPVQVRVLNVGPDPVCIRQGTDNTVVATTTADTPVPPSTDGLGVIFTFNIPSATAGGLWLAAIALNSGTATVYFTVGSGGL